MQLRVRARVKLPKPLLSRELLISSPTSPRPTLGRGCPLLPQTLCFSYRSTTKPAIRPRPRPQRAVRVGWGCWESAVDPGLLLPRLSSAA